MDRGRRRGGSRGSRRGDFGGRGGGSSFGGKRRDWREKEEESRPVILSKPHPVVDNNEEEWPSIASAASTSSPKHISIKSRTESPSALNDEYERQSEKKYVVERRGRGVNEDSSKDNAAGNYYSNSKTDSRTGAGMKKVYSNPKYAAQLDELENSPELSVRRRGLLATPTGAIEKEKELLDEREREREKPLYQGGVQLVSEQMDWLDSPQQLLTENPDFLVVGIIGPQGTGKSTLLSMLAQNDPKDMFRQYIFRPASREATETSKHQSVGIQMYVTASRVILLDTQPLSSPAILDEMIRTNTRYTFEYTTVENFLEVESLQIASFMFQVCHVLLATADWFVDLNYLRFLRNTEMIKPSPALESGYIEHLPHLVLVHHRAKSEDFQTQIIKERAELLKKFLTGMESNVQSGVSMNKTTIAAYKDESLGSAVDVNYFVLPDMKLRGQKLDVSKYRIVPEYEQMVKELRLLIRSLPKTPFSQNAMSEKSWFQFAGKAWENVRKSNMIAEIGRTLP